MSADEKSSFTDGSRGSAQSHDFTDKDTHVHIPRRDEENPEIAPGAAIDIDAGDMPDDGVVEVHDTDEDILSKDRLSAEDETSTDNFPPEPASTVDVIDSDTTIQNVDHEVPDLIDQAADDIEADRGRVLGGAPEQSGEGQI